MNCLLCIVVCLHVRLIKLFLAIWLHCCLQANLRPVTGKMNKPLLCLILQHAFQFTPIEASGGVRALLLPSVEGKDRVVRLTTASTTVKNLAGVLTPRDVQEQNVQLVSPTEAAGEVGRPIDVGGLLKAPSKEVLEKAIQTVLQDKWKLSSEIQQAGQTNGSNANAAQEIS